MLRQKKVNTTMNALTTQRKHRGIRLKKSSQVFFSFLKITLFIVFYSKTLCSVHIRYQPKYAKIL